MVDFMLQDAGIPAAGLDHSEPGFFVHALYANFSGARNDSHHSGHAQAAFEEFHRSIFQKGEPGVDDHMERNGSALSLSQQFAGGIFCVFRTVLNHCQLQRMADLRRSQTYSGGLAHGLSHRFDQLSDARADNLLGRKGSGRLSQDWIACLYKFKLHRVQSISEHRPKAVGKFYDLPMES